MQTQFFISIKHPFILFLHTFSIPLLQEQQLSLFSHVSGRSAFQVSSTFPAVKELIHRKSIITMIPLKNSPEPSTKCMGSSPGGRLEPYVRSSKPHLTMKRDFPGNSAGKKKSVCNAEDLGLIPGLGRSPGGGKSNPLHYSCLKSPHGQRTLVGYSLWGCKKSDTTERLSTAQ